MDGRKTKIVATRVTLNLAKLIEEYCKRDAHVNLADFLRDAIREKLQRDVPELYSKLFQETPQHE